MNTPERRHHYKTTLMDSARWDRFRPRSDDIVIATPYKAGTTWTQRICSLLIFQSTELERPITAISPWLDAKFAPIDEVIETYESQTHRRFVKTHTPLSGIPYFPEITYIVCGRDPRDIFLSMENHYANVDRERFAELLSLSEEDIRSRPVMPDDVNERFKLWLTKGSFAWESDGFPFWSAFYHLQSYWKFRELPNIHFIHYQDLKNDLGGEMRRIAKILGIEVLEERWPELIEAATFSAMKNYSSKTTPNVQIGVFRDPSKFFNRGISGQWKDVLSEENLALYETVKAKRLEPTLRDWIDRGCGARR